MPKIDPASAVRNWVVEWNPRWSELSVKAVLRVSEEPGLAKAVATLETPKYVGSVTVWGNGMLEFIVLELASKHDVIMFDVECETTDSLRKLLDECANTFNRLALSN